MKRLKYLIIVVMLAITTSAMAETQPGIILRLRDGSTVGFALESKPKILPHSSSLEIVTDKTTVSYSYSNIASIYSGNVDGGGIESPTIDKKADVLFTIIDNSVEVSGLEAGETVTAYTSDGRSVCTARANADNETLRMTMPSSGVYIIRTSGGVSFKFITK